VRGASSQVARGGAPSLSQRHTPPAVTRRISHRIPRTLADDERGVAVVEFALILPVLLGIVLGIIQFGTAFNYWNDLNQVAADGARYAAVNKVPSGGTLTSFVQGQADTGELRNGASVCVQFISAATGQPVLESQAQVGDSVKITASYPFRFANIGPLSAMAPTIRGNATMRLEQMPTFAYDTTAKC
jgi:Flp pilus assembly protein TadG